MEEINEKNKDLIENRIPFEFLDEETQKRMENWAYGFKGWDTMQQKWVTVTKPARPYAVYRAKPAPEINEQFDVLEVDKGQCACFHLPADFWD